MIGEIVDEFCPQLILLLELVARAGVVGGVIVDEVSIYAGGGETRGIRIVKREPAIEAAGAVQKQDRRPRAIARGRELERANRTRVRREHDGLAEFLGARTARESCEQAD